MSLLWNSMKQVAVGVTRNKGAKLAALILAILAWYAVRAAISFETVVTDIPLALQVNDGWTIMSRSARTVDVVFKGSQDDIRYLNRDQVKVAVDLRGQPLQETMTVPIVPSDVTSPGAARALYVQPAEITVQLDREGEKQAPVKVDFQGSPQDGYELEKVVCTPASVRVFGPERRLAELETLYTTPVDLEDRTRSFRKNRVALAAPADGVGLRFEPDAVQVEALLVERAATQVLRDLPVDVLHPPGSRVSVEVWPGKVTLTLKGRTEALRLANRNMVRTYVDCTEIETPAQYNLPVRVSAPPGLAVAEIEPPLVQVNVKE